VHGSLCSLTLNPLSSYACGLGNVSNNFWGDYSLWEGVKIARERRIPEIAILGD
jgi:hypothetical protein